MMEFYSIWNNKNKNIPSLNYSEFYHFSLKLTGRYIGCFKKYW